jgi:hypothetical protein
MVEIVKTPATIDDAAILRFCDYAILAEIGSALQAAELEE